VTKESLNSVDSIIRQEQAQEEKDNAVVALTYCSRAESLDQKEPTQSTTAVPVLFSRSRMPPAAASAASAVAAAGGITAL
jgi:hypothetical protein